MNDINDSTTKLRLYFRGPITKNPECTYKQELEKRTHIDVHSLEHWLATMVSEES
jgi:hypothetical protein